MVRPKEELDRVELHYKNGSYKVYPVGSTIDHSDFPIWITGTPDYYFLKDFYTKYHSAIEQILGKGSANDNN